MMMRRVWPELSRGMPDAASMLRDFGRLFDAAYGPAPRGRVAGVFPPLNVTRDDQSFYVRAELPGTSSEDLSILVENRKLAVSGTRKPLEQQDVSYHRRERTTGSFSRTITLPADFDAERVEARFDHGVLTVVLPLAGSAQPRQIPVQTA